VSVVSLATAVAPKLSRVNFNWSNASLRAMENSLTHPHAGQKIKTTPWQILGRRWLPVVSRARALLYPGQACVREVIPLSFFVKTLYSLAAADGVAFATILAGFEEIDTAFC
jgi:hypothetical protein